MACRPDDPRHWTRLARRRKRFAEARSEIRMASDVEWLAEDAKRSYATSPPDFRTARALS